MKALSCLIAVLLTVSLVSADNFQPISDEELNSSEVQALLNYGLDYVWKMASERNNLEYEGLSIDEVTASKDQEGAKTYYKFHIKASNQEEAQLDTTFIVRCQANKDNLVTKWQYHVEFKIDHEHNEEECPEEEEEGGVVVEEPGEEDVPTEQPEEDCEEEEEDHEEEDCEEEEEEHHEEDCEEEEEEDHEEEDCEEEEEEHHEEDCEKPEEEPEEHHEEDCEEEEEGGVVVEEPGEEDVPVEEPVEEECDIEEEDDTDDEWVDIPDSACHSDEIQNLIYYGLDHVVENEPKKIPQYDYQVTEIVSASKKETSKNDYYRFEIKAQNDDNTAWMTVKFTLRQAHGSTDIEVQSYSFSVRWSNS